MTEEKQSTRNRMLDAAKELFAQRGFQGVSVRQIGNQAGANVSLAYYHWNHYFQLVAQVNGSTELGGASTSRYFDPLVSRVIEALSIPLADSDDADIFWSYHFLSGVLTLTFAETGRIGTPAGGVCQSYEMAAENARRSC